MSSSPGNAEPVDVTEAHLRPGRRRTVGCDRPCSSTSGPTGAAPVTPWRRCSRLPSRREREPSSSRRSTSTRTRRSPSDTPSAASRRSRRSATAASWPSSPERGRARPSTPSSTSCSPHRVPTPCSRSCGRLVSSRSWSPRSTRAMSRAPCGSSSRPCPRPTADDRERLREVAVALFDRLGLDDPLASAYRRRLAAALY